MRTALDYLADLARKTSIPEAGEHWSQDNARFEATNPTIPDRFVRTLNPMTGFGSAMGAMHDAASQGSGRDAALAFAQALPVFASLKLLGSVKKAYPTLPVKMADWGRTAEKVAGTTAGAVLIDTAQAKPNESLTAPGERNWLKTR